MTIVRNMANKRTTRSKAEADDDRTFGQIVRDRRVELDWSQGDLAKRLNVGQQTVSRWEAGEALPRPRTVRDIAHTLSVPSALILMKAGYLSADEMPGALERPEVLDRVSAKIRALDERDRETIERMIDAMLNGPGA